MNNRSFSLKNNKKPTVVLNTKIHYTVCILLLKQIQCTGNYFKVTYYNFHLLFCIFDFSFRFGGFISAK